IWKSQRHIAKIPIECGAMPYGDTDLPGIGLTNFRPARVILHRFRTTLRISEYDAFRIHKRESRLRARRSFLGPVPHLRGCYGSRLARENAPFHGQALLDSLRFAPGDVGNEERLQEYK